MKTDRRNISISLRDLALYLCGRWRAILVCLVVGAIVFAAYSAYESVSEVKQSASSDDESRLDEKIEKLEAKMSAYEIADGKGKASTIIYYLKRYEYYAAYVEKSPIYKMDTGNMYKCEMTYYINNPQTVYDERDTAELNALSQAYINRVQGEEMSSKVSEAFGISTEDALYYYDGSLFYSSTNGTVIFTVYGDDLQFIETLADIVKEIVEESEEEISGEICEHEISLVSEQTNTANAASVMDKQQTNISERNNALTALKNRVSAIEGTQLTYVKYLVKRDYNGENYELAFESDSGSTQEEGGTKISVSPEFAALGAAAGLILSILVIVIAYSSRGALRCYDDLEYCFGVQVLGTYDDPLRKKRNTRFDRFIREKRAKEKTRGYSESVDSVAGRLKLAADKLGMSDVCIAASCEAESGTSFGVDVAGKVPGVNVSVVKDMLRNADACAQMRRAQGVVLLEQTDKSKFQKIDEEIQMCEGIGISVIGAVVVK